MNDDSFDWGEDSATFGDRLARAREASTMTQGQLARRLGVKLTTIRNWEADRSEPRANRLQMLAGLLNVSMIWLLSGEGEGGPETAADAGPGGEGLAALAISLRELRVEQTRLAERAGRIEKQLRALMTTG